MQQASELDQAWSVERQRRHFFETITFTETGIALGRGTLLIPAHKTVLGKKLVFDGQTSRILALLTTAYGGAVSPTAVSKMQRASDLWQRGETALAQIHLTLLGLPRLDEDGAHRLFLANLALQCGASARDLMKALGFDPAFPGLEKYDPDQPRVPAGNGRESGRWGSDGEGSNKTFVMRAEIRIQGRSASNNGTDPSSQSGKAVSPPILTPQVLKHIHDIHDFGTADLSKGKFTLEYSTDEQIKGLVQAAWEQATPQDLAAGVPVEASSSVQTLA